MLQAGGKIHGKSESSLQRWVGSIEKWREARISPRALLQEGLCPSVGCWLPPKEAGYGQCGFVGLALFGFMWPETLPVWYRHLVKTNNSSVRLVLLHIWKRNNNDSFDDAIDDWIWRGGSLMRWMVEEELDSWACHFHRWRYDLQCTHPAVDVQITAAMLIKHGYNRVGTLQYWLIIVVEYDAYNFTQKNVFRT